ncbi:MAG: hypothetical protein AAF730_05760 [Bacteroidota bacterium]
MAQDFWIVFWIDLGLLMAAIILAVCVLKLRKRDEKPPSPPAPAPAATSKRAVRTARTLVVAPRPVSESL